MNVSRDAMEAAVFLPSVPERDGHQKNDLNRKAYT